MKNRTFYYVAAFILLQVACTIQAQNLSNNVQRILGNWNNANTQEWQYGFFEEFAIYDNDFWTYESVDISDKKARIVLKKGTQTQEVKLTFTKADSVCIVKPQKGKKYELIRYTRHPGYTTPDHSRFIDNGYQMDSVTIIGYFRNYKNKKEIEISVFSFVTDDETDYNTPIDSLGRFRITVPLLNTCNVSIDGVQQGLYLSTTLEPKETILLYCDTNNRKDVRYMGTNARIHQELANWKANPTNKYRVQIQYDDKIPHETYMQKQCESYQKIANILNQYIARHPDLSDKFKYHETNSLLMGHASDIMQRRFALKRSQKERFNPNYMDYADSLYAQIPSPYTLSPSAKGFLRDYLDYYNDIYGNSLFSPECDILLYFDQTGRFKLTEEQKQNIEIYKNEFEKLIKNSRGNGFKEEDKSEALIKATEKLTQLYKNETLVDLLKNTEKDFISQLQDINRIKGELLCFDHVQANKDLKELITAQIYCNMLDYKQYPLGKLALDFFKEAVSNPSLRTIVFDKQAYFERMSQLEFDYPESLQSNEPLKGISDANELWQKIIEPHKGKVIYVDFWGTWCSPCKKELKEVPAIRKAMEGKDVVFMYLASYSEDNSWRTVIKQNRLTGTDVIQYNLPQNQQDLLQRLFSINSYPTHILINKKGETVNKQAPGPMQREYLLKTLNKLVAE